jgi:hypothetical protein
MELSRFALPVLAMAVFLNEWPFGQNQGEFAGRMLSPLPAL